ncbi:protein NEGATIVE GRAVITROPIC RESPONSE OF ROOTS-like isoform X2 [Phragmites australis]|uniref:protein NEGATIVE GRAVITROPIC RESPONSE OF ROOTS-like isoform X2 n=1 Tax=Phragmites australis TaxID=29695 RepID=UPI002D79013B|nr:protein NEGATIVE GRAVITROPIC RESPONSE OF ROOTS-like isoform X2 [Phragmites australis]
MGVLNWVQRRIHGAHHSKRNSEFSTGSVRSAEFSDGLPWNDVLDNGWITTMLSIGTCGTRGGNTLKSCDGSGRSYAVGADELKKLREELMLLMRAKGVTTAEELNRLHHLPLERLLDCTSSSKNGGTAKPRSVGKPIAFTGFLPRSSFRETVPELRATEVLQNSDYLAPCALLHKNTHPQNSAFSDPVTRNDRAVQMPRKGKAHVEEEGGKWIRTDSEYIVLEI